MNFLKKLFRFKKSPKAIVFVDYEYWYYSYRNLVGTQPDVEEWITQLKKQYDIIEVKIFANFTLPGLINQKRKLEKLNITIVNTEGESAYKKKDVTDFVMSDSIYQCAVDKKRIGTYILFTGDGHFHSVVRYLVEKKRKEVIVYGVVESTSRKLMETATCCITVPQIEHRMDDYIQMIIDNLAYATSQKSIIPTFKSTIDIVSRRNNVKAQDIHMALTYMLEQGYVVKKDHYVDFRRKVKVVSLNWDKLIAKGYWDPKKQRTINKQR